MITQRVLDSVVPLADSLSAGERSLSAVSGTVLQDLVASTLSPAAMADASHVDALMNGARILDDSKRRGPDGEIEHDAAMAEFVELAANAVTGGLALARNVVLPNTKAVFDLYAKRMDDLVVNAQQAVVILPNVYADIWGMPQLQAMVERHANAVLNEAKITRPLPKINGAELLDIMKTGIDSVDEAITDWFENLAPEKALESYNKIFVRGEVKIGRQTTNNHFTPDGSMDRSDILLAFLVAGGFEEKMPDGVNIPLQDLRLQLARVREQSGRALNLELARRDNDRRGKILVYGIDREHWELSNDPKRIVKVNNDVYRDFLEAGGTPESIYGAVVRGASTIYQALIDEKDANEKAWAKFSALHNQRVAAQIFGTQRESLRLAMIDYLNQADAEELPMAREDLRVRARECIGQLQPKDFTTDELSAVRRVVCDVLYPHTNARMVLDAMETAELENPDMSPRECGLMAVIDLLARWMAAQIQVHYH